MSDRRPKIIYLTGFWQHAGKTTTSLGIISQLRKHLDPAEIGYLKPVGQHLVRLADDVSVDKDVQLLQVFSGIPELPVAHLSPVRFGQTFTRDYLDHADPERVTAELQREILASVERLTDKRLIIAEGSGHPGVGSVVGLSNAAVGKLLGADTIFVSGGGIGRAIDMIDVDLTYFLYHGCNVLGLIVNKVAPGKMDQVRHYITPQFLNARYAEAAGQELHVFGYLPAIEDLTHPSMRVVLDTLTDAQPVGDPEGLAWLRPCGSVRTISLPIEFLKLSPYVSPRDLLIISASSTPRIRKLLEYHGETADQGGVGGLVLTCGETEKIDASTHEEIVASGVPAVYVQDDSASTEERLFGLYRSTKLQTFDTGKVAAIEQLFEDHFDTDRFIDLFLS